MSIINILIRFNASSLSMFKRKMYAWLLIISIEDAETVIRLSLLKTEPNKLNTNTIHLPLPYLLLFKLNSGVQIIHCSFIIYYIGGLYMSNMFKFTKLHNFLLSPKDQHHYFWNLSSVITSGIIVWTSSYSNLSLRMGRSQLTFKLVFSFL